MLHSWKVASPQTLHEHNAFGFRELVQFARMHSVLRKRLLAQHMLPGLKGHQHLFLVQGRDRANVHNVHVGIGHQVGVAGARPCYTVVLGECLRFLRIPGRNNLQHRTGHLLQAFAPIRRNRSAADDAPAQAVVDILCLGQTQSDVKRRLRLGLSKVAGPLLDLALTESNIAWAARQRRQRQAARRCRERGGPGGGTASAKRPPQARPHGAALLRGGAGAGAMSQQ
mmetsp:Transcript_13204/g.42505  ORF Transcript_13204/g.42505 Transcript_13204/m.42505 type:complete len:226 (-) Transcript_13204:31-708(-)